MANKTNLDAVYDIKNGLEELDYKLMQLWSVMKMSQMKFDEGPGESCPEGNYPMNLMALLCDVVEGMRASVDEIAQTTLEVSSNLKG